MPVKPLVERHPKFAEILEDMAKGMTENQLADKYNIHRSSIHRYMVAHREPRTVVAEKIYRDTTTSLMEVQRAGMAVIGKVMQELEERLTDPNDPNRYWLGPREEEIDVVYTDYNGDKPVQKRCSLVELLHGKQVDGVRWRIEDPRKMLLSAVEVLGRQVQRAEALTAGVNDSVRREEQDKEVDELLTDIVRVLEKFPKAKTEVLRAIRAKYSRAFLRKG